jgi:hypothetical protein
MSQFPPYQQQPMPGYPPPAAPRGNGAAVASLICGILGCVPVITSLAAIILGFVGISKSRQPGRGGKGMAIAGIVLGLIGLIVWAFLTWATIKGVQALSELAKPTHEFIQALQSGDMSTARAMTTADVTDADLQQASNALRNLGEFEDVNITSHNWKSEGGATWVEFAGTARFANGTRSFDIRLDRTPEGFRVSRIQVE